MSTALMQELEAEARALTLRVVDEMYRDPFWSARFGERGRKFSEEDGQYHVTYLVQALGAQQPEVLARYARWLRSVLTARGMCTRHLTENFERLALAVRDLSADGQLAVEYLEAACGALRAELGRAQPLAAESERLTASVCAWLDGDGAAPEDAGGAASLPERQQLVASLLSYLADAVALGRAQQLVAHVLWLDGWLAREPAGRGLTARLLAGMERRLQQVASLPAALRGEAGELLSQARSALEREADGGARSS